MPGMVRWIMRILIAGASGLIGTALSGALRSEGHDVVALVRRAPASPAEFQWCSQNTGSSPARLEHGPVLPLTWLCTEPCGWRSSSPDSSA